jgi:hypothetical protein
MPSPATRKRGARPIVLRWSTGQCDQTVHGLLAFVQRDALVDVWCSLDARAAAPARIATIPGPFGPRGAARYLVEADLGAAVEAARKVIPEVEGVGEPWQGLVARAWERTSSGTDPRARAVFRLDDATLGEVEGVRGLDAGSLLETGAKLLERRRAWLGRWRDEIEAILERRMAAEERERGSVDAGRREAHRAAVEEFVAVRGRLPVAGEAGAGWSEEIPGGRRPGVAARRRMGILLDGRTRTHRLHLFYVSPSESLCGGQDEVGWYFLVTDPDDSWLFNDPAGPYRSPGEAMSDASYLDGESEDEP